MGNDLFERLHQVIVAARSMVDDQTASIAPEMYDEMKLDGSLIRTGTRINWKGKLKRAAVDLWDMEQNTPDNAPNLWEAIEE